MPPTIKLEKLESLAMGEIAIIARSSMVNSGSCDGDNPDGCCDDNDNPDGCCGDTDSCGEYPPNTY